MKRIKKFLITDVVSAQYPLADAFLQNSSHSVVAFVMASLEREIKEIGYVPETKAQIDAYIQGINCRSGATSVANIPVSAKATTVKKNTKTNSQKPKSEIKPIQKKTEPELEPKPKSKPAPAASKTDSEMLDSYIKQYTDENSKPETENSDNFLEQLSPDLAMLMKDFPE